jgi:general secretion pathway protein A
LRILFGQWGRNVVADALDPCPPTQGLRCLHGISALEGLLRFNRPALLSLSVPGRGTMDVVLTRIAGSEATIALAGQVRTLTLAELSQLWTGEYLLLWRPPPGSVTPISYGDHGPMVTWISQRLTQFDRIEASSDVYDETVGTRVRRFQADRGLKPDGVVGPQTLMQLALLDPFGPKLIEP